ncbi:MAG: recombinase family protein [Oscillospiraceae bacterium]|nr:recombinase family protein [Oscillospiraceae bacterium]
MNTLKNIPETWNADGYLRLSRLDRRRDKDGAAGGLIDESNSIKNQRDLIRDFVSRNPDIRLAGMLADDGATGADFDREQFKTMIGRIEAGETNCVIVKDFSRLGRDHIETGKYIERYFASKNVRFISINDNYDSIKSDMSDSGNSLIIPFKNIINEAFLEDISVKTRTQLEIKRRNGELVCNFAVYGYRKEDKKLIPDEYAADIVRAIFEARIRGYSDNRIASELNARGVLSPAAYKKSLGLRYNTPFSVNEKSLWSAKAINRILTNRVYIGALEQGKRTKASYRVKKTLYKPREAWSVHENDHEPIVSDADFELVRELLAKDTRVSPETGLPHTFAGFVVCGHCGQSMYAKTVKKNGKTYLYYICSTHRENGTCRYNGVSAAVIEKFALESIRRQVSAFLSEGGIGGRFGADALRERKRAAIEGLIEKSIQSIKENNEYLVKAYGHFVDGVVTEAEYRVFSGGFKTRADEAERNIAHLREEISRLENDAGIRAAAEKFKSYGNISELDRRAVATLIDSVVVYNNKNIEIRLRYFCGFDAPEFAENGTSSSERMAI